MNTSTLDVPANPNVDPHKYNRFWFRFLEILPGLCVWTALISPFILAKHYPLQVTIFIIIFDVFWLQKAILTAVQLSIGYKRMRRNLHTNWNARLDKIANMSDEERETEGFLHPQEIYQAVILPTYKEELAILQSSIGSIVNSDYPKDRLIFVLATEERDKENARKNAEILTKQFGNEFFIFMVTEHPDGIVGEVKGKGANATWAAKKMVAEIQSRGINPENVIVSTADADTRFHKHYLGALAFRFATTRDRIHTCYQPIATFLNNVWEAPMISRVMAFATTFWQLSESTRDYRLLTFSTHAMCLQTLIDMNYWCISVVNEDSRQFFRAYFHYKGNYRSLPLFLPVYMDAVHLDSSWQTIKNLYLQQQRWAYGVEHFPYIVLENIRQKSIPLAKRVIQIWRAFNGAFSWSTNAFFIAVVGWLPIWLNSSFQDQVVASNFPVVTSWLLSITWIGTFASTIISLQLLPPKPKNRSVFAFFGMIIQWVLVPVCTIVFGALPGLDAQTHLMFGKYLGFRVTPKKAV